MPQSDDPGALPVPRDAAALAALMEQCRPRLLAIIEQQLGAKLRGKIEPADVLQEVAIKALRELPDTDFSAVEPFAWLCHLAGQCVIDGSRRFSSGKRDLHRELSGNVRVGDASQDFNALLAASITSPTQAVVRNERQRRLAEAIAALPAEHQQILRLRYEAGLSSKAIGERIGKPHGAVRVMLSRIIDSLEALAESEEPR